ncbi:MAG: hypothetical protein ACQEQ4_06220 [Fibrobacterota bacterium]
MAQLILLLFLLFFSCTQESAPARQEQPQYTTRALSPADTTLEFSTRAELFTHQAQIITARRTGVVSPRISAGDEVDAGDLLFVWDSYTPRGEEKNYLAALQEIADLRYENAQNLQKQGNISRIEYLQAKKEYTRLMQRKAENAAEIAASVLTAGRAGVVFDVPAHIRQNTFVHAGDTLGRIGAGEEIYLRFFIPNKPGVLGDDAGVIAGQSDTLRFPVERVVPAGADSSAVDLRIPGDILPDIVKAGEVRIFYKVSYDRLLKLSPAHIHRSGAGYFIYTPRNGGIGRAAVIPVKTDDFWCVVSLQPVTQMITSGVPQ